MSEDAYAPRPCVYIITHVPTKRHYVGKANDVRKRWRQHVAAARKGQRHPLYRVMRDRATSEFQIAVAEEFDTESEAYEAESWWIEFLRSDVTEFGFNICSGGRGGDVRDPLRKELRTLEASQALDMRYQRHGSIPLTSLERLCGRSWPHAEPREDEESAFEHDMLIHRRGPAWHGDVKLMNRLLRK